jgi:HAD superfamily hydrolase (TIGR01484 family)
MRSLHEISAPEAKCLSAVFTDIDGTLTDAHGRIPARVFTALEAAQEAGLAVIPITGRPAGWCDLIARTWPVDGVVGENGGLYFRREDADHGGHTMLRAFAQNATERATNRARLDELAVEVLSAVPGTALASDQAYRVFDIAIDFCEDVPRLPESEVDRIVALCEAAGCTVKVSSIHVNAWIGSFDKASMCLRFGTEVLHQDFGGADADRAIFFGDSPNDAPLFGLFPQSVGVAGVRRMADRIETLPTWITDADGGDGFVEGIERILSLR